MKHLYLYPNPVTRQIYFVDGKDYRDIEHRREVSIDESYSGIRDLMNDIDKKRRTLLHISDEMPEDSIKVVKRALKSSKVEISLEHFSY